MKESKTFANVYDDRSYIISDDNRQTVTVQENGRKYILHNSQQKHLTVYKIDGGLIKDKNETKCDFGIYVEDNWLFLVELKGGDYEHALRQIENTIRLLVVQPNIAVGKLNARVVLSKARVPDTLTTKEKKLKKLLNKYHGTLDKKSQAMTENLP